MTTILRDSSINSESYDQARWDERYRSGRKVGGFEPDAWFVAQARHLQGGRALDVACGRGRHALWLARMGYQVDAVDISLEGLQRLAERLEQEGLDARVRLIQADLEVWRPDAATYDLILVSRYLNRDLIASFWDALKPGGLVLYRTFHTDWARLRSDFQRGFLLQPGEFTILFRDWEWLAYEERRLPPGGEDREDCMSAILAKKPDASGTPNNDR